MKPGTISRLLALAALSTLNSPHSTVRAQGSLTPPVGTPAPVMKSLDQIEARTPISSAPFNITKAGSYYLTTNLNVSSGTAITINTNNVTLDLNGFSITSTDPTKASDGILIAASNVRVANGSISSGVTNNGSGVYGGPGFNTGIYLFSGKNVNVSRVNVSGTLNGIKLATGNEYSTSVLECNVATVSSIGILADVVTDSTALGCGGTAISGTTVSNCHGRSVGSGMGIDAYTANNCKGEGVSSHGVDTVTASACHGVSVSSSGIYAQTAVNSSGTSTSGIGLEVLYTATGCAGYSSSGVAIFAAVANSCTGNRIGGTAIHATVANGCYAYNGTNIITYKYNMP